MKLKEEQHRTLRTWSSSNWNSLRTLERFHYSYKKIVYWMSDADPRKQDTMSIRWRAYLAIHGIDATIHVHTFFIRNILWGTWGWKILKELTRLKISNSRNSRELSFTFFFKSIKLAKISYLSSKISAHKFSV